MRRDPIARAIALVLSALVIIVAASGCDAANADDDPPIILNSRFVADSSFIHILDNAGDVRVIVPRDSSTAAMLAKGDSLELGERDAYADGIIDLTRLSLFDGTSVSYVHPAN